MDSYMPSWRERATRLASRTKLRSTMTNSRKVHFAATRERGEIGKAALLRARVPFYPFYPLIIYREGYIESPVRN